MALRTLLSLGLFVIYASNVCRADLLDPTSFPPSGDHLTLSREAETSIQSTVVPITTTTASTPGPHTTVKPEPLIPNFIVKNDSQICLMMQMNIKVVIPYYNKKGEPLSSSFYINSTNRGAVKPSGICNQRNASLSLKWFPGMFSPFWMFNFFFNSTFTSDSQHFMLSTIVFNYSLSSKLFPDTNDTSAYKVWNNHTLFTCPIGSYFACMARQTVKLTPSSNGSAQPEVFLSFSTMKVEAFRNGTDEVFVGARTNCSADYAPSKIVPIIVGVALAVMIVIALLTFFIGRRPRRDGYQNI